MAIAGRNRSLVQSVGSQGPSYPGVCLQINSEEETSSFLITIVQGLVA